MLHMHMVQVEVGDRGYRTTWFYGKMKSNGTNMQASLFAGSLCTQLRARTLAWTCRQ